MTLNDYIVYHIRFSLQSGYSRFPVHEKGKKDAFIGLLLAKTVLNEETMAFVISYIP